MLQELADTVRGLPGIAHQEPPGAAELGVHVGSGPDAAFLERPDQRVDAVAVRILAVGPFLDLRDEAGVIDQEADVRKALRDGSDVAALAVLVGLLPERQALVHADDLDAEAPRLLDEADADFVVEVEAVPVRPPLRIG